MRYLLVVLVTCMLVCPQVSEANPFKGKKEKQAQQDRGKTENASKSVYDKLFKDKKLHTESRGLMTVHRYEDKLYLELPLALTGREFLLNSFIKSSSDLELSGKSAANPQYLTIEKTDSLVLFRVSGQFAWVSDSDENHAAAFGLSHANAVARTFSIAGYTPDSTSVVFEITSYFTGSNTDMLQLKGRSYKSLLRIRDCSPQSKVSYIDEFQSFNDCVSITEICTAQLIIEFMGMESLDKPEIVISLQMVMTLLPEKKMNPREADPHIGSGTVAYSDYRGANGVKNGYFATKRDITPQNPVVFYVDTLLKPTWREAIRKSADEWNTVFEKVGVGRPVVLRMFGTDSAFRRNDPLVNTVSFLDNDGEDIFIYSITDPRSGEILSSRISISRNFASAVRKKGIVKMAAVDKRFRTYFIPDDAVCEALTAYMLKAFGHSLGLAPNLAGSMACSPEQLRSPSFTQENGITASVMDDVLYNYLARPGDKERGVALVVSKPGVCDEWALRYLYSPMDDEGLRQLVKRHDGDPRYFYGGAQATVPYDPRCQLNDLGNDPLAAIDAKIAHLKFIVDNSPDWFKDGDIPENYRTWFPDFVYTEFTQSLITLFRFIGGVYTHFPGEGTTPRFQSVPASLQRDIVRKITGVCDDLRWMDANPEFLRLGGANSSLSDWIYSNGLPLNSLMIWLNRLETGLEKASEGKPYTGRNYLDDIEKYVFSEILIGKPFSPQKMILAETYIGNLIGRSPALKSLSDKVKNGGTGVFFSGDNRCDLDGFLSFAGPEALIPFADYDAFLRDIASAPAVRFNPATDIETLCYEKLADARRLLRRAKSLTSYDMERGKCDYLIMLIDRVLL